MQYENVRPDIAQCEVDATSPGIHNLAYILIIHQHFFMLLVAPRFFLFSINAFSPFSPGWQFFLALRPPPRLRARPSRSRARICIFDLRHSAFTGSMHGYFFVLHFASSRAVFLIFHFSFLIIYFVVCVSACICHFYFISFFFYFSRAHIMECHLTRSWLNVILARCSHADATPIATRNGRRWWRRMAAGGWPSREFRCLSIQKLQYVTQCPYN